MRNQESTATFSSSNLESNRSTKKESILDQFIVWFRDFLDNAE
ncbi:phosphoribosylaminoimidazolecarboxamide formyltransferase [Polaribacter sp. MSW13]|uniref:Phosphoribosylaminoimidazolecarboxamide formyltransferase n=1 Tax=Polaribacter marinus TaxID=2916838 RepID=A0A9X1VTK5_9FLAO|nr:phosphoribosylaminoimidazolecarboxamide formyltransferase [Polaribacter marinus]MCI2229171.1 phosphoribosylaminoimidazolecarboxamide formyltransferase [Polaribacter marinus]